MSFPPVGASFEEMKEFWANESHQVSEEERNPFGRHRWVKLKDLNRAEWNGLYAEIIQRIENSEDDRFKVRVQTGGTPLGKVARIKRINLEAIPDEDTVKVCRISCDGEENFTGGYVQTVRWPEAILQASASHECTVSKLLGFPLRITKVQPRSALSTRADFDNQWVTWMMIEPISGFAPMAWQGNIGPVVVWREGGGDVSSDDMSLLNDFLSGLLDMYGDGPGAVDPGRDLTPRAWARFRERELENRALNVAEDPTGMMTPYDDINI